MPIRAVYVPPDGEQVPLFTGRVDSVQSVIDQATRDTHVTITAVDAVQSLANTTRYGAAAYGADHERWEDRYDRVMQSARVPWTPAPRYAEARDYTTMDATQATTAAAEWDPLFALPTVVQTSSGRAMQFDGLGMLTLTGLVPGQRYTLTATVLDPATVKAVGIGHPDQAWDEPAFPATVKHHVFIATSSPMYIGIDPGQPGNDTSTARLLSWTVEATARVQCCNTVYESSLANHLDIIAATSRTGWLVGRDGVVRTVAPRPPGTVVNLSGAAPPPWAIRTWVPIGEVEMGYDTIDTINTITLTNHARTLDEQTGEYAAADQNLGPWADVTSEATYGRRSDTVDITVADLPGTIWATSTADLAAALLAAHATPGNAPERVTWLTWPHTDRRTDPHHVARLTAPLDPYDPVGVAIPTDQPGTWRFQGSLELLTLTHEITAQPQRWKTTATLRRRP